MTSYGSATYTYTATSRRESARGSGGQGAHGELLTKTVGADVTSYQYDVFGNLRHVELPDGTEIDYVIDAQNRRIGKRVDGVLVEGLLYKDQLEPVAELDGSGAVVSRFVYGTRPHVPEYLVKGGVTYRIVSDHLGSVRLVVNAATGAVAQKIDYDEYGRVLTDSNPGFQPFGFAGGIWDGEVGLVRFGWRDYDPVAGRWTTKDPIGFAGGSVQLYAFASHDPINRSDPSGLAELCVRPLDGAGGKLSDVYTGGSEYLDRRNREPIHEQFWFDDGTNKGFFGDSQVGPDENFNKDAYGCYGRRYDDATLKEATENLSPNPLGEYSLLGGNNCQDWVDQVLHEYERLRLERTRETGEDPETSYVIERIGSGR